MQIDDERVALRIAKHLIAPKKFWSAPTVIRSEIEETDKLTHLTEISLPILQGTS